MICLLTSNLIELTLSSYFPLVEYFDITALQEAINKKKNDELLFYIYYLLDPDVIPTTFLLTFYIFQG